MSVCARPSPTAPPADDVRPGRLPACRPLRRSPRRARLLLLVAASVALSACTGDDSTADSGTPAAVDTDAVQTDAPAEQASVFITYAGPSADSAAIDVSAYVEGLVEDGGSCTATAKPTSGSAVTSPASTAEAGPTTTDCGPLSVPTEGGTGPWSVSVTYTSENTDLTSATTEVQIP